MNVCFYPQCIVASHYTAYAFTQNFTEGISEVTQLDCHSFSQPLSRRSVSSIYFD